MTMTDLESANPDTLPAAIIPGVGGLDIAGLAGLASGGSGELGLIKPYTSKIFLTETHIAGTTYIEGIDELVAALIVGERLLFRRDVANEHDESAISIITEEGSRLGYIPQKTNEMISNLLDGGKVIFAEVAKCELKGTWHKISIQVYFED